MPAAMGQPLPKELHVSLPNNKSFFKENQFRFNGEYTVLDIEAFTLTNLLTNGLSAKLPFITDTGKTGSIQVNFKKSINVPVPEYDTPVFSSLQTSLLHSGYLLYTLPYIPDTRKIVPRVQVYIEFMWKLVEDNSLYIYQVFEFQAAYKNGDKFETTTWHHPVGSNDLNGITFVPNWCGLRVIARTNVSDNPVIWNEVEVYNGEYM
jgi:hypothetical protein